MGDLILAEKSDLIMLANTIREKTGSTDQMSFVDGFVNGINNLGSGSAVETCVLTCSRDNSPVPDDIIIYYTDESFQLKHHTVTEKSSNITLIKGSLICINHFSSASYWSSTLTRIEDERTYAIAIFCVEDSGTLKISLG